MLPTGTMKARSVFALVDFPAGVVPSGIGSRPVGNPRR